MLNGISRTWLMGGTWLTALAVIVVLSVALDANLSTSVALFVLGVVPLAVMLLLGVGVPPPTVAEILHTVNSRDGR